MLSSSAQKLSTGLLQPLSLRTQVDSRFWNRQLEPGSFGASKRKWTPVSAGEPAGLTPTAATCVWKFLQKGDDFFLLFLFFFWQHHKSLTHPRLLHNVTLHHPPPAVAQKSSGWNKTKNTHECTGSGKYRRKHIQPKTFLVLTHHHLSISASIHKISQHKPWIGSRKHESIHEHVHPASIKAMNHPPINLFIYLYSHSVDKSKISESIHPVIHPLSTYPFTHHPSIMSHMRIHPSVCLSVHSFYSSTNHFKINESIHPVIHPPINPSLIHS